MGQLQPPCPERRPERKVRPAGKPIWTSRIIVFCGLFNLLILYYRCEAAVKARLWPGKAQLPVFESWPYVEVVTPQDAEAWPYRVFKSSPWTPPNITIAYNQGELADGYLFLTPQGGHNNSNTDGKQPAGLVISQDNELVYAFDDTYELKDLRPQNIDGIAHLTYWHGDSRNGHGAGEWIALDGGYGRQSMHLTAALDLPLPSDVQAPGVIDYHEHETTPWGTVLVTAYNSTPADLSGLGGPRDGWVLDSLLYEIDIATQTVVFSWSALEHLPVNKSRLPLIPSAGDGTRAKPYDFFHINSVQATGKSTFLINSPNIWSCFLVARQAGEVLWELHGSGKGGDFGPTTEVAQFRWQHHARAHNISDDGMAISLFDNHGVEEGDSGKVGSRGLVLDVRLPPDQWRSPTVLGNLPCPEPAYTVSHGSFDASLSNANQLLNYGTVPVVREFSHAGAMLWEGRFGVANTTRNYRVYKHAWHATPQRWGPSLVLEGGDSLLAGYVSWNGATEVEAWNVYEFDHDASLRLIGRAARRGFETEFRVPGAGREAVCIVVAAVQGGQEGRLSNVACLETRGYH